MEIVCINLNIEDQDSIAEYEKALYEAFEQTQIKTLGAIWDYDNKQRRLKTKISYKNQKIYVAKINNKISAAMSINCSMKCLLQLEMLGFSIDKSEANICEGLALFSCQMFVGKSILIAELVDYALRQIRSNNVVKLYGTCSKNKLRTYKLMQFDVIDEKIFQGEQKYLIVQNVQNAHIPRYQYDRNEEIEL